MEKRRLPYLDALRVLGAFFVVMVHVTSAGMHLCEPGTGAWRANTLINSLCHWAVPVFFMISGALFLDPRQEISVRKLYRKNLLRIVLCIGVWGFLYSLLDQYVYGTLSVKSIWIAAYGILTNQTGYHLWFLYTLGMLYIAVPLFRLLTAHATKR